MFGGEAVPETLLGDVKVKDYDALISVGGSGAPEYWDNETAHTIARETLDSAKLLAAVCIAPVTLANAGVLEGRKATLWPSEKERLRESYTGKNVEVDESLIIADGPNSAKKFAQAIVEVLSKK